MTTDIIDVQLHTASIPSTYNGAGTVIGNPACSFDGDVISGYFTSDGNATQINNGFAPTKVVVINWTDGIRWEWFRGAPATNSLKYTDTGPALAIDTNSQIVINVDTAGGLGDVDSVTLGATLCGTSKVISYRIEA